MKSVFIDGKSRPLGQRIGKGGEGEIYLLADERLVAIKIYTVAEIGDRASKVRALVAGKLAEKAPLVAFPIAEATTKDGKFLGFAMRLVEGHKPLHELYAPGSRKIHFAHADYRFLVRSAANIARAVASVHASGCVIGDINHSGFLVSPKAVVALIDADSFQVTTAKGRFLCRVGVPEYTPPELQGKSLAGVVRTVNHDAFGLAVIIFQLLFMGRHPFVGTVRKGDIPPLSENIEKFRYVYAEDRDVGMDQPPATPAISDFYPALVPVFNSAFSHASRESRPSAASWVQILDSLERDLIKCTDNALHFVPKGASECAWCDMERQLNTHLFVSALPAATLVKGVDPGAVAFDIEGLWVRIQQVRTSTSFRSTAPPPGTGLDPSSDAKQALSASQGWNWTGVVVALAAVGAIFVLPRLTVIWLMAIFWGVAKAKSKKTVDRTPFTTGYVASEQLLAREFDSWNKRNGVDEFLSLYSELEQARDEYALLRKDEERQISRYTADRRTAQLNAFLGGFPLDQATIKGIGAGRRAILASYGIDTAADVNSGRLIGVPGFGEVNMRTLLDWRAKLEKRFTYRPDLTAADHAAIARIRAQTESKCAPLRSRLVAGPQNLSMLASRLRQSKPEDDVILARAIRQRDQARRDLEFLGFPVPNVPAPQTSRSPPSFSPTVSKGASSSTSPRPVPAPSPGTSAGTSAAASCPRCGQQMIKRLARKGRNAGSYFWGCSRYPVCKGTRNI